MLSSHFQEGPKNTNIQLHYAYKTLTGRTVLHNRHTIHSKYSIQNVRSSTTIQPSAIAGGKYIYMYKLQWPLTFSGRLNPLSTKWRERQTTWFSCFLCCLLSVVQNVCRLLKFCDQSKQHYQGLLSWRLLCQELLKKPEKNKNKIALISVLICSIWSDTK